MTPQEFLQSLIELKIIQKSDVISCTEKEVKKLEESIGSKLPEVFREYLLVMGQGAGNYNRGTNFLYKDLFTLTEFAKKTMLLEQQVELPNDIFVIFSHQGCIFGYFRLSDGDNPPVYTCSVSSNKPLRYSENFSEYLDKSLEEEKSIKNILKGL